MRSMKGTVAMLLALCACAAPVHAKTFRYANGPKPPADSALAVANNYFEPVVASRGPRVPYTNLQMAQFVADSAVARTFSTAVIEAGAGAVVAPARDNPLNFVVEHAILKALAQRGVNVTVRRSVIPDDSLRVLYGAGGDPVVEYSLGTAKVTYLRFVGFLPGRVKIERQALVTGTITMRDPNTARLLWTGDVGYNFVDRFNRGQVALVEEERYPDLKADLPQRNIEKVFEPVLVLGVIGGLVALFFANRP